MKFEPLLLVAYLIINSACKKFKLLRFSAASIFLKQWLNTLENRDHPCI